MSPLVVGGIFEAVIIAQVWKRPQIAGYLYGEGLHAWRTIGPWHREMNREGAGRSVGVRRCGAVCGDAIAKIHGSPVAGTPLGSVCADTPVVSPLLASAGTDAATVGAAAGVLLSTILMTRTDSAG